MATKRVGTAHLNTGSMDMGASRFIDAEGVTKKLYPSPNPMRLMGTNATPKPPFRDKNLHIHPTQEKLP